MLPAAWEQEIVQENDWFDLRITIRVGKFKFPFAKLIAHIRDNDRFYLLPDDTYFLIRWNGWPVSTGWLIWAKRRATNSAFPKANAPCSKASVGGRRGFYKKRNRPFPIAQTPPCYLASLPLEGTKWLAQHYEEVLVPALPMIWVWGKTLQTLAILLLAKRTVDGGRRTRTGGTSQQVNLFGEVADSGDFVPLKALVILPASLVFNWEREVKKFTPGITTCNHTGPKRTKDIRLLERYDIVFTTYQTARRDLPILQKTEWEYVVLDESQYIKNPQSGVFKAVGELNTKNRISLSGTPIENSLSDLWAQMEFLNPVCWAVLIILKNTSSAP